MSQSNTQQGQIVLTAHVDLTGKEGLLVKVHNDADTAKFALPTSDDDLALYVLTDGDEAGKTSAALPLASDRNVRIRLEGTCVPGDILVLADTAGDDAGKVRALPGTNGTYRGLAIAEEAGIDTQLVKARPAMIGTITVTE